MTNAAYAIHDDVVKSGVQPSSDAYYEAIDSRMREEFPHKFKEEVTDSPSPSRNTSSYAGWQRKWPFKESPTLTFTGGVAKRLGVPLEEYAKQFVALDK